MPHHGKAPLLLEEAACRRQSESPLQPRERRWSHVASAHLTRPSGLGSGRISRKGLSALNEPDPPGSCRQLCESSLCFVISVLLSARASARSSCWQKSMFSHRRKYLQTSVFFLRAVNKAACSSSCGAGDGSSVTARLIHALAEPRPPSGSGCRRLDDAREAGAQLAPSPVHRHPCTVTALAQPAAVRQSLGRRRVSKPRGKPGFAPESPERAPYW